jgi:molecular chaperone GrpE
MEESRLISTEDRTTKESDRPDIENESDDHSPAERDAQQQAEEKFDITRADKETLVEKYTELELRLREAEESLLRTVAEGENFKKRLQREKEEQTRYANEALMRELLPVIDNLERALQHSEIGSDQESVVQGISMTLKGFADALGKFGCSPIEAVGKPFDPNFHEAVAQEENSELEPNTVIRELQKGYVLRDRLLRPAMVVVSKSSSEQEVNEEDQTAANTEEAENGRKTIKVKKF